MKHKNPKIPGMPGGSVSACIDLKGEDPQIGDAGAYCAAIADKVEPGWRKKNPVYLNAYSLPYNYPYSYFYTEPNTDGQYGYMHPGAGYQYPWDGYGGWYPYPGRTLQPHPPMRNPVGKTIPRFGPTPPGMQYTRPHAGQYGYPPLAYQGVKENGPDVDEYGPDVVSKRRHRPSGRDGFRVRYTHPVTGKRLTERFEPRDLRVLQNGLAEVDVGHGVSILVDPGRRRAVPCGAAGVRGYVCHDGRYFRVPMRQENSGQWMYPGGDGRWPYPTYFPAYTHHSTYWPWEQWRWTAHLPPTGRTPSLAAPGSLTGPRALRGVPFRA